MPIIDDKTIFQPQTQQSPVPPPPSQPPPTSSPPPSFAPPPAPIPPPLEEEEESSVKGLIIKVILGIVALLVISLIGYFLILPFFSKDDKKENVTLVYWGLWEDAKVMDTVISDFERENPHINIDYKKQDSKEYRNRLETRISNGNGPDIFRYHNTWVGPLLQKNMLVPVASSVMTPDDFKKTYYPVMQNDLVRNGAIYGIPLHIDTLALFVNTEILNASGRSAPRTWDEFTAVAQEVTTKDENGEIKTAGAALGTYDNITHAPDIMAMLFSQSGVDSTNITEAQEAASSALKFYTDFANERNGVWNSRLDQSVRAFANESLAMYFGYSWDIYTINAMNPALTYTVHPVPKLAGGESISTASYWVEGISAKSLHQEEAMLFLRYLARKETSQKLYSETVKSGRLFGELYARRDLAKSLENNSRIYPFLLQAPFSQAFYLSSDTQDGETGINTRINAYLGDAIRSVNANTSPETAIATFAQGVAQVLTDYGQN